jgi:hypothetical protein
MTRQKQYSDALGNEGLETCDDGFLTFVSWTKLGAELRASSNDMSGTNPIPSVDTAYAFLLENPECFGFEEWPQDMPGEPNIELIWAYYNPPAVYSPSASVVGVK